ncbi:MAG: hypothetical protein ORN54_06175 [Cyclobacteriaceae bacterium]|nr:hypothetical protein [Cyclobacteriaceae bacterium]
MLTNFVEEFRRIRIQKALNALSLQERSTYARAWLETPEGQGVVGKYDEVRGRFKDAGINLKFESIYLVKILSTPYQDSEFVAWLRDVKGLDPAKLGL